MEVTLDIGKNIVSEIEKLSEIEKTEFDVLTLKILDLGLRVYQSSVNHSEDENVDPVLEDIFKNTLETNFLLKEIMGHVFSKEKSTLRAYDHSTAINVSENMATAFVNGKKGKNRF